MAPGARAAEQRRALRDRNGAIHPESRYRHRVRPMRGKDIAAIARTRLTWKTPQFGGLLRRRVNRYNLAMSAWPSRLRTLPNRDREAPAAVM